jgi:hypothetical protein
MQLNAYFDNLSAMVEPFSIEAQLEYWRGLAYDLGVKYVRHATSKHVRCA